MDKLLVFPMANGRFAVRPSTWAGIWDSEQRLTSGRNVAEFEDEQVANEYVALKEADQKRTEGCAHCTGDVDSRLFLLESEKGNVYIDGNGNLTIGDDDAPIRVCPMCGRDLRGESHDAE